MSEAIRHALGDLIAREESVVIDGAMSTALEALGEDLNDELWSAKTLMTHPERVRAVHRSYFRAGANVAITASYQASEAGFAKRGLSREDAAALIRRSVALAKEARDEVAAEGLVPFEKMLVAGSVGPYGAFLADGSEYTGCYSCSKDEFAAFHSLRIESLIASGADLLAIETQPRLDEIGVVLSLLKGSSLSSWVTMTLADEGHLPDGSPLREAGEMLDANPHVDALGFNCVKRELVAPALEELAKWTKKPLIVYPNSGENYDPTTKTWHSQRSDASGVGAHDWSSFVPMWRQRGARCIGGCCRTLPQDIIQIAQLLKRY